eukprot:12559500-Alexandrium_andersonii.AAC.1
MSFRFALKGRASKLPTLQILGFRARQQPRIARIADRRTADRVAVKAYHLRPITALSRFSVF